MKTINNACSLIQSLFRMFSTKRLYNIKRGALIKIRRFVRLFRCFIVVKKRKLAANERGYISWKPDEIVRRATAANTRERDRLSRMLTVLRDCESKCTLQLKKHLRTSDGRFQIQQMVENVKKEHAKLSLAYDTCQKELLNRCIEANKSLAKHDFNCKGVIPIKCADPSCFAAFTSDEQYHAHMSEDVLHKSIEKPKYSAFHLMLRSQKGIECIGSFIAYKKGIESHLNCLDMWIKIQEFRKTQSATDLYNKRIISIFDLFLADNCERPINFSVLNIDSAAIALNELKSRILAVKYRSFDGFYRKYIFLML